MDGWLVSTTFLEFEANGIHSILQYLLQCLEMASKPRAVLSEPLLQGLLSRLGLAFELIESRNNVWIVFATLDSDASPQLLRSNYKAIAT